MEALPGPSRGLSPGRQGQLDSRKGPRTRSSRAADKLGTDARKPAQARGRAGASKRRTVPSLLSLTGGLHGGGGRGRARPANRSSRETPRPCVGGVQRARCRHRSGPARKPATGRKSPETRNAPTSVAPAVRTTTPKSVRSSEQTCRSRISEGSHYRADSPQFGGWMAVHVPVAIARFMGSAPRTRARRWSAYLGVVPENARKNARLGRLGIETAMGG